MFSQELKEYILHGKEETYLEYKGSLKWVKKPRKKIDIINKYTIVKAMLAMSNHPGGGVIVIGEKEKGNGEFRPIGIGKEAYDSFKYDDIARFIKNICSPQIQFKITRDSDVIDGKNLRFVIMQVSETLEIPLICTKLIKYNDSKPAYPDNILLRENAIYIRPKSPIESREISNEQEWRELIGRKMENSKKELLKKMPCFEYLSRKRVDEKKPLEIKVSDKISLKEKVEFKKQLKRDEL